MNDISYFMVIFIISLLAFSICYFLIGRNQEYLINLEGGSEEDYPVYNTMIGAFHHVYLSAMGEFDTEAYFLGEMSPLLIIFFHLLSFFMCIHLLNMLIAIMGESFSKNNEVSEAKTKIS